MFLQPRLTEATCTDQDSFDTSRGDPLAIAAAQAAHEAKKRKWKQLGPDGKPILAPIKQRKKVDRFDGIPEDEVAKRTLPDHLGPNLDIVIVSTQHIYVLGIWGLIML